MARPSASTDKAEVRELVLAALESYHRSNHRIDEEQSRLRYPGCLPELGL